MTVEARDIPGTGHCFPSMRRVPWRTNARACTLKTTNTGFVAATANGNKGYPADPGRRSSLSPGGTGVRGKTKPSAAAPASAWSARH